MKKFQVWTEGYAATGQSSDAQYHGEFEGETFREAVAAFRDSLTDEHSRNCVDLERLSFWGCRFFDNEDDARKSFG
jgi:hypothetical protein